MTENKPVAWAYEFYSVSQDVWVTDCVGTTDPANYTGTMTRNIKPLYRHPPAPTDAKPVAWLFDTFSKLDGRPHRNITFFEDPTGRDDAANVEPLYRHPPAPQPDPDPAVEAARRKALRAIFAKLEEWPWACDTARGTGIPFGALRDLVGQPRKYPERAIRGYDNDGPPGPHPAFGEKGDRAQARLSVDMLASIMANSGSYTSNPKNRFIQQAARAVHEAIYGKDA